MTEAARRPLSPRQAECLRRVRMLQTADQIAADLGISPGTVRGYIREAVEVLGARDRRHAALIFADMEGSVPREIAGERNIGVVGRGVREAPVEPIEVPRTADRLGESAFDRKGPVGEEVSGSLRSLLGEISSGARPDGWSFYTRGALILASVVVAGFAVLAMSASLGAVHSLAVAVRDFTH